MSTSLAIVAPRARRADAPTPPWQAFLVAKPEVTSLTIEEVARKYLEHEALVGRRGMRTLASAVEKHVIEPFGAMLGRELLTEHVIAWVRAQVAGDYAPETVWRHRSHLSGVCEHGIRLGAFDRNPCLHLPRGTMPSKRPRDKHRNAREMLRAAQVDRVLVVAPQMRRILWALCALAGLRFGEAAGLTWGQINRAKPLDELTIDRSWDCVLRRLGPTKTDEVRLVPVHPRLARLLRLQRDWFVETYKRAPNARDPVAPFVHMYRDTRDPQRWHVTTARKWWRRDLADAHVPRPISGPRKLHCARHTFISLLANAKVPREVRMAMTHSTDEGDAHAAYSHFEWSTLCDAVMKLGVGP